MCSFVLSHSLPPSLFFFHSLYLTAKEKKIWIKRLIFVFFAQMPAASLLNQTRFHSKAKIHQKQTASQNMQFPLFYFFYFSSFIGFLVSSLFCFFLFLFLVCPIRWYSLDVCCVQSKQALSERLYGSLFLRVNLLFRNNNSINNNRRFQIFQQY